MDNKHIIKMRVKPFKAALEFLRTGRSPAVDRVNAKFHKAEKEKLGMIEECLDRGQLIVKAEKRADAIDEVKGHSAFLVKDRKAAIKRRRVTARDNFEPRGNAGDHADWDKYEVCRSIDDHLKKARKEKRRLTQLQAAARVIENYNVKIVRIECSPETLCTYYRRWKKRRK